MSVAMNGKFDIVPARWVESGDGPGVLELLDQRLLPHVEIWLSYDLYAGVADAIRDLVVRGAPAIGVAAGYAIALAARRGDDLDAAATTLKAARPTAVNLAWAVDQVCASSDPLEAAHAIAAGEHDACRRLGANGSDLVPENAQILTHCNAGALATGGYGSALGVVRGAVESGKDVHVWVDETRPVLQGARLTAWELTRAGIANTLIVDAAAGSLMARGEVDLVVVGADRIAANGDFANKIGTYPLALCAAAHDIPFYVAAPVSTIDAATARGGEINIEQRGAHEVIEPGAAARQVVHNPAFDITPARLVTALVTERGVVHRPDTTAIADLLN